MNKNTSYYIRNWKNHVSNKRLLFAIPDFEKVFGKENLINKRMCSFTKKRVCLKYQDNLSTSKL